MKRHTLGAAVLVFISMLSWLGAAGAQQPQPHTDDMDAIVQVASPGLSDADYRQSVVLVVPIEGDRLLGAIINRPTRRSLASLFPEHQPSKKVA